MIPGKKFYTVTSFLFIFTGLTGPVSAARSVYVISDTQTSHLQAYKIDGTNLIYQTNYMCQLDPPDDSGSVAIAIDDSEYGQFLFSTFEYTDDIELINAKTMQCLDAVKALNATKLSGIDVNADGKYLN